jgi:hypothetical protein
MKNIRNICSVILVITVLISGCAPGVHRSTVEKDKRTAAEDRFDPLGFPGDDAVITGNHRTALSTSTGETELAIINPADSSNDSTSQGDMLQPDQTFEVFRVQVFASKAFDEAQQFAANIQNLFPEGVFVEYQMPYYKVRVGEFITPEEGESFLDEVKQLGFKNAWLVRVFK